MHLVSTNAAFSLSLFNIAVDRRRNLLKKELRRNLFYLFAGWSGRFSLPFEGKASLADDPAAASAIVASAAAATSPTTEFEFSALKVNSLLLPTTSPRDIAKTFRIPFVKEVVVVV